MIKKKRKGRRFVAEATITNIDLARAKSAIRIRVFDRGEKLGELELGRGSLMWFNKKSKVGGRVRWHEAAELLREATKSGKRKKR